MLLILHLWLFLLISLIVIYWLTGELFHVVILNILPWYPTSLFILLFITHLRHLYPLFFPLLWHKLSHYPRLFPSIALFWFLWYPHSSSHLFLLQLIYHSKVMWSQWILLFHFCLLMSKLVSLLFSLFLFFHFLFSSHLLHWVSDSTVLY